MRHAARLLLATALLAATAAGAADRETLARLEARSKAFYELVARGQRAKAAAEFPGLAADLEAFASRVQAALDDRRDEVAERDGDLDALFKSADWRESTVQVLVATYHLAWVNYQGAQLTDDAAAKKRLLRKAVDGFSEFLLVGEVPEIYAESLYGRGLAFMDLGETANAVADLKAAAGESRVRAKAEAALAEAERRRGGRARPADDAEAHLAQLAELLPRAANDARREDEATKLARGLAARGGTWPGRVASLVADELGDARHPRTHYGLFLLAQLAVDRGRCGDVAAFARASAGLQDKGRARHRPEILFLDAGCRLNAGQARAAAEGFGTLLAEFPDARRAGEATYYRVRALAVARADDPGLDGAYEEALGAYLARYPKGTNAGEVRFLLAELYRGRGDCERAAAEYAQVSGDWARRARLGALECRVAALARAAADGSAEERAETIAALRTFVGNDAKGGDALTARAALLGALTAAAARPPDDAAVLAFLDGFETRFPESKELHARAVELRLGARVATGDLVPAAADLEAFLASAPDDETRRRVLARVGRALVADVRSTSAADGAPALAMARTVYRALLDGNGTDPDRIILANLDLAAGDAPAARRLFEEVLARDETSAEALRGAARAAAAAGDRAAAFGYWRTIVDASPPGGTAWYEARIAQVELLVQDGMRSEACEVLRLARGRATTVGGDQLEARLAAMEPEVCR